MYTLCVHYYHPRSNSIVLLLSKVHLGHISCELETHAGNHAYTTYKPISRASYKSILQGYKKTVIVKLKQIDM